MATVKNVSIKLVGCDTYSDTATKTVFTKGKVIKVTTEDAERLLNKFKGEKAYFAKLTKEEVEANKELEKANNAVIQASKKVNAAKAASKKVKINEDDLETESTTISKTGDDSVEDI